MEFIRKLFCPVLRFIGRIPCAVLAVLQVLASPGLFEETVEIDCEDWYARILA